MFGIESVIAVAQDAELERLNMLGQSCLQIAAALGNVPVVEALLKREGWLKHINNPSSCNDTFSYLPSKAVRLAWGHRVV